MALKVKLYQVISRYGSNRDLWLNECPENDGSRYDGGGEPEVVVAWRLCARPPKKLYIKGKEDEQTIGKRVPSVWHLTWYLLVGGEVK
jgi:hypothetical protein